jgi:predicted transcriptional regulator
MFEWLREGRWRRQRKLMQEVIYVFKDNVYEVSHKGFEKYRKDVNAWLTEEKVGKVFDSLEVIEEQVKKRMEEERGILNREIIRLQDKIELLENRVKSLKEYREEIE